MPLLTSLMVSQAWATWDGEPSLDDVQFNLESFIDISSYQFRHSEEIAWYGVENGARIASGSLETNYLYLLSDLRLKQAITPFLNFRLQLNDEEFYEPREFPRPLLELEGRPTAWPLSFSLIGSPAYAKRDADLGFAATLGERPWNFLRLAWLNADNYFNEKNDLDEAFYAREPSQLTLEGAYRWADRYKLRLLWQDNNPLEFVLDDQISVFAYENRNFRLSFDYQATAEQHYGIVLRGFETTQSLIEAETARSQDIRYFSVDAYWFRKMGTRDEWTLGLRYDDFVNEERTPPDDTTSFDYTYLTAQVYTSYYHPFSAHQAWELGLHLGQASQEYDYLDPSTPDTDEDRFEAKLRAAWELFSIDQTSALTIALSMNLDEIIEDPFDGGAVRFRTQF
jgi:hypothetical protein